MSIANPATAPRGGLLEVVERTAWRVPLPTRRFLVTLALAAAAALAASGVAAGWVASRNAATIADAREQGLELATAVSEFRTRLASADARAAGTLLAGGLEDPESRALYDEDLLAASHALTDAGLVATDEDRDDITAMADGLLTYAGLVETARANARQGFPVGASYLDEARDLANRQLVPLAERQRRVGEQRIARAANSVGGPLSGLAVLVMLAGLAVLVGCAVLLAGRTRRVVAHPALLVAVVIAIGTLVVVFLGISAQARELRQAASGDIDAYVAANEASSTLAGLRVTEISAVAARGSGGPLYADFAERAAALTDGLTGDPGDRAGLAELSQAVGAYTAAVEDIRQVDEGGDNREAATLVQSTEPGGSAHAYQAADAIAAANVARDRADLERRFEDAAGADLPPLLPVVLCGLAAVLAAAGTLARGRRYR
ncbi:MAG TPA: hypothetical protein VFZ77_18525 [Acidimicrobiales bacterium]